MADALRFDRLSVLSAEAGAGKTTLLRAGLLPLLGRRAFDGAVAAARAATPTVLHFPERRSAARARLAELVVFVDAWDDTVPLGALHERIDAALRAAGVVPELERTSLPERVQTLGERYGTRVLFVFDGFEAHLRRWDPSGGRDPFVDELVQLLTRRLPANVLIALRTEALALLEPLIQRLFNVDVEVLTLSHWHEQPEPSAEHQDSWAAPQPMPAPQPAPPLPQPLEPATPDTPAAHAARAAPTEPTPPAPLHPDEIYADIARMLAQIRGLSSDSAWVDDAPLLQTALMALPPVPVPAADAPPSEARTKTPSKASASWAIRLGAMALASTLAFLPSVLGKGLSPAPIKTQAKLPTAPVAANASDNGRASVRAAAN